MQMLTPLAGLPPICTRAQVACVLGCSERHIRRLEGRRRFPIPRLALYGRLARYKRADLERWLALNPQPQESGQRAA